MSDKKVAVKPAKGTSKPVKEEVEKITNLSVMDKLARIRHDFRLMNVEKSGVNAHAEFKYWELDDIIPVAEEIIYEKYNCLFVQDFRGGEARGTLINLDDEDDIFVFGKQMSSIVEPGKYRMNEIQADGAQITYYRRYLYFILLDICTPDEIDAQSGVDTEKKDKKVATAKKSTAPATTEERAKIQEELTQSKQQASELQIKALKNALKEYRKLGKEAEDKVKKIIEKTNKFTNISSEDCEKLVLKITKLIEETC